MPITQNYTHIEKGIDEQHDRILHALNTAIAKGWLDWKAWDSTADQLTPWDEFEALGWLAPHRAKLKKLDITYPTKAQYHDRLYVEPQGVDLWVVQNLTKGTEYEVAAKGLRLDCTCDTHGNGFCKHRDAVEDWRDANVEQLVRVQALPERAIALFRQTVETQPTVATHTPKDHGFTFPEGFTPSDEQAAALQSLGDWFQSEDKLFRLTGPAGTGKSTIIQAFIRHLRALPTPPAMAVAAPYNKAKKVQEHMLRKWGLADIKAFTCAQLFGVKGKEVGGEEVFERDHDAYEHYRDYRLVVIDEVSTINLNLWEFLLDAIHDGGLFGARFILMGDAAQLPPVGEAESMAFRHPCPSANLTKVMRYDGPIAVLADHIRQNLSSPTYPEFQQEVTEDKKGIYVGTEKEWMKTIELAFTSQAYRDAPDTARILAYTNARVNMLNVAVRNALGCTAPWVVGERIIALSPYSPGPGMPVLSTSEEATVTGCFEGTVSGWECFYLQLDTGDTVPVPRNPIEYRKELKARYDAKEFGRYWSLKRLMANITYGYALTAHRAQGSTFKYVFVDVANMYGEGSSRKPKRHRLHGGEWVYERNQLLYVALTRASHRLFIFKK